MPHFFTKLSRRRTENVGKHCFRLKETNVPFNLRTDGLHLSSSLDV